MLKSLARLPISILEECSVYLHQESLSQLALVSKRLHLTAHHRRWRPKHLDCTTLSLEVLQDRLAQTQLAHDNGARRLLPPLGRLTYRLFEQPPRHEMIAEQAAKTDVVLQILKANKGVPVFVLEVELFFGQDVASQEVLLSTISKLAEAAQCKNGTVELRIGGYDTVNPADATVRAVLAQFPTRSAIVSVALTSLYINNITETLQNDSQMPSLKTLALMQCALPMDILPNSSTLTGLEKLLIEYGPVPLGIIQSNAVSLRTLHIRRPRYLHGVENKLVKPFQAHFPRLQNFTLEIEDAVETMSTDIEHMFLFSEHITMPAVTHLRTYAYDVLAYGDNAESVLKRFPSLKRWTMVEWDQPLTVDDPISIEEADPHPSVYSAVARACEARHVRLEVNASSVYNYHRGSLAYDLRRAKILQRDLCRWRLNLSGEALEDHADLNEPASFPKLRELDLVVKLPLQEYWGQKFVALLHRVTISAPLLKQISVEFEVNWARLDVAGGILEGLAFLPGFPSLERITGTLWIEVTRDIHWTKEAGKLESIVSSFRATLSKLQRRSGVDFTDLDITTLPTLQSTI